MSLRRCRGIAWRTESTTRGILLTRARQEIEHQPACCIGVILQTSLRGCGKIDCKRGFPGSAFFVRDSNGFADGSPCVEASRCLRLYPWNINSIGVIEEWRSRISIVDYWTSPMLSQFTSRTDVSTDRRVEQPTNPLNSIWAWGKAFGFKRIKNVHAKTGEIFHVPRNDGEVVVKGCRRNHSVHNGQGHSLLLRGGG